MTANEFWNNHTDQGEPQRVPSPGGWVAPAATRAAWNWTPPGGAVPAFQRAPAWFRFWLHTPILDRYAYSAAWWRGYWDVIPMAETNVQSDSRC